MKKFSGIILVALMVAMVLPSCKKYEEGPTLSFRSKTSRLVNEWKIEKYSVAAIDVTSQFQRENTDYVMNIKEDGTIVYSYTNNTGDPITFSATWEFNSDKTGVVITIGTVSVTNEILKLKKDELWLKYTDATTSTIHEMHYVTK